jgi:NAD(P)-dependent dehydrogenase (short-subunit alcohol dehydrogenase family)
MAVDLAGKTAIVTGSSKGIGLAIAESLAKANANVVISARNEEEVKVAAARLEGAGSGRVLGIPCDVGDYGDVRRLVAETVDELGGLDILINNAGIGRFGPVDEMAPEDWDTLIETNLSGVFYCCHEAIPHLKTRGDSWIINIASLAGKNPFAGGAAYNASKFGLVGFSEALMLDVRHHGIRVNYIMPGSVATYFNDHTPSEADAWKIQPEDIAEVVMDLLALPSRSLVSRVEIRPSQPPKR